MTTFHYLCAEEWGMTWKRPPVAERLNDPEAFVHHSAGSVHVNDAMTGRELAILHMQRSNIYAQLNRDYSAIGYDDYVIDLWLFGGPDEVWICEARGRFMSAATWDRNEQGEAVCVGGMFHPGVSYSVRPRDATIKGVTFAIANQIDEGRTAGNATILGHRQNPAHPGATVCPGDWLFARMNDVRDGVAGLLSPPDPDPGPPPDPEDDDMPRYLTFHNDPKNPVFPTPVFECVGMTCVHVNSARWEKISELDGVKLEKPAGPAAAAYRTLIGGIDAPGDWSHIVAMFGQVSQ